MHHQLQTKLEIALSKNREERRRELDKIRRSTRIGQNSSTRRLPADSFGIQNSEFIEPLSLQRFETGVQHAILQYKRRGRFLLVEECLSGESKLPSWGIPTTTFR